MGSTKVTHKHGSLSVLIFCLFEEMGRLLLSFVKILSLQQNTSPDILLAKEAKTVN